MSEQGLSILDIGPLSEQVQVGEQALNVYGISAKGILSLFQRFPDLRKWFGGTEKPQPEELIQEMPDAISAIIAAGCGEPGNAAAEDMANKLPVEIQLDILEAIGRLTFKSGFGPFVRRIVQIAQLAESVSYGRAQATSSPQGSKPSSQAAMTAKASGT